MTTTRTGAPLGPQHKAAIAVLALDESVAAQLLSHLGDAEMRALAKAVEELDVVPSETLSAVLGELARAMTGPVSVSRTGGRAYVERLAALSLGEPRASRLFGPTEAPPVPAIELVKSARTKTLADLLGDEHPQIAAIIMCQLPTRTAAAVLKAMPEDRRSGAEIRWKGGGQRTSQRRSAGPPARVGRALRGGRRTLEQGSVIPRERVDDPSVDGRRAIASGSLELRSTVHRLSGEGPSELVRRS